MTTLPAVRALLNNCSCVHLICCRRPASPSPAWLRTALRLTSLFVGLFTCQSIRTSNTLTAPKLRPHAFSSARTLDCCALPADACECWPAEPLFTPHPPMVAKSCPNPRVHKGEVHYKRGTLVESRPCWQVVPFPSQSPSFPYTSPSKPSQSHSFPFFTQAQPNPAKALPFLPQAPTNTILILNPSSNPFYSRSLDFPNIFTCAKSSQTRALSSLSEILQRIL